jgi:hypothetical protein
MSDSRFETESVVCRCLKSWHGWGEEVDWLPGFSFLLFDFRLVSGFLPRTLLPGEDAGFTSRYHPLCTHFDPILKHNRQKSMLHRSSVRPRLLANPPPLARPPILHHQTPPIADRACTARIQPWQNHSWGLVYLDFIMLYSTCSPSLLRALDRASIGIC